MLGWRLWVVGHGTGGQKLVSPFVTAPRWAYDNPGIDLPTTTLGSDGVLRAECPYGCEDVPGPCGFCGLYFCTSPRSLLKLAPRNNGFVDLRHPAFAVTVGETAGPISDDPWHFPDMWAPVTSTHPGSYRCAEYRPRAILGTAVTGLTHYGVPVYQGTPTLENLMKVDKLLRLNATKVVST
ncbi:MAG TPA: hypothetical protein VFA16_15815 [Mycobacterium sp.]|uniref:hypothetical protein n=1 Tax=Mycobacterium sp. TaxID=1785 RepID=UPI002D418C2C|nr:hypothetical protein [Mycobacterium sp.]HZU48695.1 hypothetical protein [Mycobacterium sp.]